MHLTSQDTNKITRRDFALAATTVLVGVSLSANSCKMKRVAPSLDQLLKKLESNDPVFRDVYGSLDSFCEVNKNTFKKDVTKHLRLEKALNEFLYKVLSAPQQTDLAPANSDFKISMVVEYYASSIARCIAGLGVKISDQNKYILNKLENEN